MIAEGDSAPEFTAPLANGDVAEFSLSDRLGDRPVVLAFFPGAFTSVCSDEMNTIEERLASDDRIDADVYGVSVDTPFALNEFRDEQGLSFPLISDSNRTIVDRYGLAMESATLGVANLAKRAVLVLDEEGTVTYAWVSNDPGIEPDYDELERAVRAAT